MKLKHVCVCVVNLSIPHYLIFTNGSKHKTKLCTEVFLTNFIFKLTRSKPWSTELDSNECYIWSWCNLSHYPTGWAFLGLGDLSPTWVTIQLADRSVKVTKGEINDVLIRVGEFIYPVDFIVLETQPLSNSNHRAQTPVILGQPFLATANAIINCRMGPWG